MKNKSISSYISAFRNEFNGVVGMMQPYHVFTAFCARYFYYNDSSAIFDDDFKEQMPDGKSDGGIDAVFANPISGSNEIVIIQGKYYRKTTLGVQELKDELNKIIDTVSSLLDHGGENLNDNVKSAFYSAKNDLEDEDNFTVHIDFCTLCEPTNSARKQLLDACAERSSRSGFQIRFLSQSDILRQVVSCETATETVDAYTVKIDKANNVLRYQDAIVVNVSARSIYDLYQLHQNKVLGLNLRYHIKGGKQLKAVDSEIRNTINDEPECFWYFNNGIVIACDKYSLNGSEITLNDFSIINGGQTTYQIAHSDIPTDFYVQCKIVKISGKSEKDKLEFSRKIARATNSQKPIKLADLRANDPEQQLLKRRISSLGFYYVTKAGDKPPKNVYKNFQITNLDKVGKVSLAGALLLPGTARSNSIKMFDSEFYETIFTKTPPRIIIDLLTLAQYFKCFQREALRDPDKYGTNTTDCIATLQNGEKYYLACIGIVAKMRARVFKRSDITAARSKGDDILRPLLFRFDDLDRILKDSVDTKSISEKVFAILTRKVISQCCKFSRSVAERSGNTFATSNYLKRDDTFINDIYDRLCEEYLDEDSKLKVLFDDLLA